MPKSSICQRTPSVSSTCASVRRVAVAASRARSCSRTSRRSARGSSPVLAAPSPGSTAKFGSRELAVGDVDADGEPGAARQLAPLGQLAAGGLQHAAPERRRSARSPPRSARTRPARRARRPAPGQRRAPRSRRSGRSPPARSAGRRPRAASASIARRRSVSMSSRRITCSCMRASKTAWRPLPSAFARYIATSASRITSAGAASGLGERDADRGGDHQLAPVEVERLLERLLDALGDHGRLARVADVVEQDRELVAAEPGDGVAGPQRGLQPPRDRDQQPVARRGGRASR